MPPLTFQVQHEDPSSHGRVGRVTTPHGHFDTPAFMPVGTQAAVKGLTPGHVSEQGAEVILANTYHLLLRPGPELVAAMGGLQQWMRWDGPILTDSGGFQVFSLADSNKITENGVTFPSHIDGQWIELTPEGSMSVQNQLGGDIIMAFDDCPPGEAGEQSEGQSRRDDGEEASAGATEASERTVQANERTIRWLDRCMAAHGRSDEQALFGIVQGGTDLAQRQWAIDQTLKRDLPGYAIGGVAVGEGAAPMQRVVQYTAPRLPAERPRYLMGVGYERDLVMAARAGVDMFDCVLPTRNGRNAVAFTRSGRIRLKNARFRTDAAPIEPGCDCLACAGGFSRSYLRHLFMAGEILAGTLTSAHNLRHFQRLVLDIREAMTHNSWSDIAERWPVLTGSGLRF